MVFPIRVVELATLVHIQSLRKSYVMGDQTVHALEGIKLDIPEGSITMIMGPSGSGKSTLLYLIGGLDKPTEGEIWVNGASLGRMEENALAKYRRKQVGFVFQSFNLVPSLDALENVCLPMVFDEVSSSERLKIATSLLKQVGLLDRSHHFPNQLSGGQQQRVAIARALVNSPRLILCDEPTGNLDSVSGMVIMELLANLQTTGRTLIVVTHDPRMKPFADQIFYILDGWLVSEIDYEKKSQKPNSVIRMSEGV